MTDNKVEIPKETRELIKESLRKSSLTQKWLASKMEMSQTTVYLYLSGWNGISVPAAKRMSKELAEWGVINISACTILGVD